MTTLDLTGKLNELGYYMVSDQLHNYLWPDIDRPPISKMTCAEIRYVFGKFGNQYELPPVVPTYPELTIDLPDKPDFEQLGEQAWGGLKQRIVDFLDQGIPSMPKAADIIQQSGWYRYEPVDAPEEDVFSFDFSAPADQGSANYSITRVPYPTEDTLIFDCETFVKADNLSVMATAVSNKAWYFWLHPSVITPAIDYHGQLISLGFGKVIINHNPKFDSSRVQETYDFSGSERNIWIDTLSMHVAVCGMSNKQRIPYKMYLKGEATHSASWATKTSGNSLVEVYNHHVKPLKPLTKGDKATRDIFVFATHQQQFHDQIGTLIHYTLKDGLYTYELAQVLTPKYLRSQPSLYTLGGHAILSTSFLPVQSNFTNQIGAIEKEYLKVKKELVQGLNKIAMQLVDKFVKGTLTVAEIEADPWLSQLDWTPAKTGATKGQPFWWRKVKKKGISTRSLLAPIILSMSWKGKPITHSKAHGWIYASSSGEQGAVNIPAAINCNYAHFDAGWYSRIPHKKGDKQNCGSPLSKDYIGAISSGTLSSPVPAAGEYLNKAKSIAYWSSMRKRAFEYRPQVMHLPNGRKWHMVEPVLLVHGTGSRRCVEGLWLTVSGAKDDVIGSELKGLVRPPWDPENPENPDDYCYVGADFDAQELKIAASYSDAYRHLIWGSTPMGYTQLLGDKDQGTDGHTLLASFLQFTGKEGRGIAKNLNFQMLYLSGLAGCAATIKATRVDLSEDECRKIADKALKLRRGKKKRGIGDHFKYEDGTDSNAYNFMLDLANRMPLPRHLSHLQTDKLPRTPMLSSSMSEAMTYENCGGDYLTSRANWGIQSSGVDLLHVFLTYLDHLFKLYDIQGWFMYPYHDEMWSMVRHADKYKAAMCFQIAHLWAWSYFFQRLGFTDLPFQYMFFSAVNIDHCFRKETYHTQITPSNPHEVPFGESLNIWQLQDKLTNPG